MTSEDVIAFSINTTDEADFSRNEYDIGNIW